MNWFTRWFKPKPRPQLSNSWMGEIELFEKLITSSELGHPALMKFLWEKIESSREERGFPRKDISDLLRMERQACGHSDYAHKLALYSAELSWYP